MRLERLEINGFKSFSDRSELAFDKGVTAIVGPNGCGKSNVADAITWVMGEQSAKSLRGDRMEDVIFSGSDARKPTAAAEVRLRFSGVLKTITAPAFAAVAGAEGHANGSGNGNGYGNGNGHYANGNGHEQHVVAALAPSDEAEEIIQSVAREVEVTRRLYRSGESEYLIDGQICRLRDVHELLMDTGLGAKAYAIIEQGKIGMILSTRPTDRRQLIEEAAGVTKYKARRRAAELKLEAAQLNLTRIDDIVFEVEKQRGTLKRQAGKARRYQKLRDELRRWEKVLFSRKYGQLAEIIGSARARLSEARERETAAAVHVSEVESALSRLRSELVETEARATERRETAHAAELAITRQQQQIAFDKEQTQILSGRLATVKGELEALDSRREPARAMLEARRAAAMDANDERDRAAAMLASDSDAADSVHRDIEGLEADVEAARSEVFSAINSATALRHSLEHAAAARDRVAETLSKLQVESDDVRIESERAVADHDGAADGLSKVQASLEATRLARLARESELASARIEHEWRARSVRAREHGLAGLDARLKSLEELQASRTEYADGVRTVLAQANGKVGARGAVADFLDVEAGYERAVEACLGDLLQHVIVERPEHAAAGFELVREERAGRCGFLISSSAETDRGGVLGAEQAPPLLAGVLGAEQAPPLLAGVLGAGVLRAEEAPPVKTVAAVPDGLVAMSSVVGVNGPYAAVIRQAIGDAWIAESYGAAAAFSASAPVPIASREGELFRGAHLVTGGTPAEARGILETKREIADLRRRIEAEREALFKLGEETAGLEGSIAQASNAIAALNAEHHRQEKMIVGLDGQLQRADTERKRLLQKNDQLALERRQAEEERDALERRQDEARSSIARLDGDQRAADERLTLAQRRLFEAREAAQELGRRAADAGATHAALVERATALAAEVQRLEEASAELAARATALGTELGATRQRVQTLQTAIVDGEAQLDADIRALEMLRHEVQAGDDQVSALRVMADEHELAIKAARATLEAIRSAVAELDVQRATAESDLAHLAQTCLDAVQSTLDDVLAEVAALEAAGNLTPDVQVICGDEPAEDEEVASQQPPGMDALRLEWRDFAQHTLNAEESITRLKAKIDRLGPVNMMAIEQFDELEARHTFLTTQRKDLVDSIAQTIQAIKRIDETTRIRFTEAFAAINHHFQEIFSTLFGGGRAGLTLLDESDPLESGIEVIAQPPGKRLQSVQLLSGGEKALTAIALMFGLFKYKPSPFCLLDEIDAPLDDANIGRFVEMLRAMLTHTQFILITHNRKTMEIADRLYGVTMEEPGVSKLISVQLN